MPIASVKLRPGVNTERTITLNEAGFSQSQLIRFRDGLPQSIGGWVKFYATAFQSAVRALMSWVDLSGNVYTAVGTDSFVSVIENGAVTNLTPQEYSYNDSNLTLSATNGSNVITATFSPFYPIPATFQLNTHVQIGGVQLLGIYTVTGLVGPLGFTFTGGSIATSSSTTLTVPTYTTTANSNVVTVNYTAHGLSPGNSWFISNPTQVGNITLFGTYLVQTVPDSNDFTISSVTTAVVAATALENNGNFSFVGFYSGAPSSFKAQLWTFDHFGQNLIACPGNAQIFSWAPNQGQTNLQPITTAPLINGGIFIAMPALIVVAWASSIGGVQQPNLVQWSDQLNYAQWTPTVTNQAGNFTIPTGTRIVGAIQAPNQAYIFTDVDVYAMTYLGGNTELVFGFTQIAKGCGLIAARAVGILNATVFWMSPGQFLSIGANGVQAIPCSVWDIIFQDLDTANLAKIVCAPNSQFNEIGWFYPSLSGGTGENDSYVKFNTVENAWDYGKLVRTAWQDYSPAGTPLGGDASGYVYQHEQGQTAAGNTLNWSWSSGVFMISEGDDMMFVDWMLPDWRYGPINNAAADAAVNVVVDSYRYANDTPVPSQTLTCSAAGPGELSLRQRGRAMQITASGTGFARLGNLRYRAAPDGKY